MLEEVQWHTGFREGSIRGGDKYKMGCKVEAKKRKILRLRIFLVRALSGAVALFHHHRQMFAFRVIQTDLAL